MTAPPVLVVRGLSILLMRDMAPPIQLVDRFDLTVSPGERWAIVGESGSGKSITARSIMGLVDAPLDSAVEHIEIDGVNLTHATRADWRAVRGTRIAMVQQDPLTALSPVFTVGNQLMETILRSSLPPSSAWERSLELLRSVCISDPAQRMQAHPHEMSGGMRQRVAIALALACNPRILIADEPTTALDVTVQAQILRLLAALSDGSQTAVIMITHDIGILPGFAHKVAVMYAGKVMEAGPVSEVLGAPRHPYTRALLRARPGREPGQPRRRLPVIGGATPDLMQPRIGCPFAPRCEMVLPTCSQVAPETVVVGQVRVACHAVQMAEAG